MYPKYSEDSPKSLKKTILVPRHTLSRPTDHPRAESADDTESAQTIIRGAPDRWPLEQNAGELPSQG
ncbi:hypothetical protein JTE90_015638 [Oedothorax gibbosus]|uniref:Uncharacterized protein n=1 Tax=Oedothorax gibbosus TaxID=931172 RepID=A0AAV6UR33_9ARAC|nr:hypothetical protein JTE90_015638 [Oedothorax gibbosus]